MPKEMTCAFCGRPIEPGTGRMYVTERGEALWFCSSKCYKNAIILRRNPRKLKWARSWLIRALA